MVGIQSEEAGMEPNLIGPDSLEIDAVVPQCLDNQYVSGSVMSRMMTRGLDYTDSEIASLRENDFKTEFMRSLIYSSQVIIQRAFLKNSDFLYKSYLPETPRSLESFAHLIREGAIVPFLFNERSLRDNLEFNLREQGDRATKALLEQTGDDVTCVRLHPNDAENARLTGMMETEFGARLVRPEFMTPGQRSAMAAELFDDPAKLQEPGAWQTFNAAVDRLVDYSLTKSRQLRHDAAGQLKRQHVYRDHFAADGKDENVVLGRFRKPDPENPFALELKKYVDLVYNVNLPDHLHRYTFTPVHMPTRMALQDSPHAGYNHEQIGALLGNKDTIDFLQRSFMAHTQNAMSLPLLKDLSVVDVVSIRRLPEWEPFKDAQAKILKNPLECLERMEDFQKKFDAFQRALCKWYNDNYQRAKTEARYCTFVSLALSIAGKLVVAGSNLGPHEKVLATAGSDQTVAMIPARVKGYAAKLMVGVYDIGARRLDSDRTYTVELLQTNAELLREDVEELLATVTRRNDIAMPPATEQVADQGVQ
jgi:hypothetical protein